MRPALASLSSERVINRSSGFTAYHKRWNNLPLIARHEHLSLFASRRLNVCDARFHSAVFVYIIPHLPLVDVTISFII